LMIVTRELSKTKVKAEATAEHGGGEDYAN
jgi:hypothetical protein